MADPGRTLHQARSVLLVHAHPDDETLATGGLIVTLVDRGADVHVLTATRGEQGEVVDGVLSTLQAADLTAHRERELADACRTLKVRSHAFLGASPARAAGRSPRRYTDSGMRWLDESETVAGPGQGAGADSLTRAAPDEIAADIAAWAEAVQADLVISYDAHGGYGHPDHVALHEPSQTAARALGIPFLEVASDLRRGGLVVDGSAHRATVTAALRCYASQLTVDGDDVVHVGGQRQPIRLACTLRPPSKP